MNQENFEFIDELNTKEGINFIYKAVNFFVFRSIDKVKNSPLTPIKEDPAKNILTNISSYTIGLMNQI